MAELISWLNNNITAFQPDEKFAAQATRHLSRIERNKLFSPEIEHMRTD